VIGIAPLLLAVLIAASKLPKIENAEHQQHKKGGDSVRKHPNLATRRDVEHSCGRTFNSIMFPCIFSLAVAELGPLTGNGSGILNMAIVGGGIVPLIQGAIADRIGIHHAFFVPVICYACILFYALSGSKPNRERYASA